MEINLNDRVEYAARADGRVRRHYVGYVKRIYKRLFTTYVEICESRTRRIDTVKIKDVFGRVERKFYKQPKSTICNLTER